MAKKRRRREERQAARDRKREQLQEYYSTSYHATPSALVLFKLARQASANHPDYLWLASVALTGYYDMGLLEKIVYDKLLTDELKETLDRVDDTTFTQSTPASQLSDVPPALSDDEA